MVDCLLQGLWERIFKVNLPFCHHCGVHEAWRGEDTAQCPNDQQKYPRLLSRCPVLQWSNDGDVSVEWKYENIIIWNGHGYGGMYRRCCCCWSGEYKISCKWYRTAKWFSMMGCGVNKTRLLLLEIHIYIRTGIKTAMFKWFMIKI